MSAPPTEAEAKAATGGRVGVVEVGPRDGLQDLGRRLPVEAKVAYIDRLVAAGARRIEAVSFVNPDRVPAMADAEEVLASIDRSAGARFAGLVLNRRGLERAVAAGVDEINYVVIVTDTFSLRNQRATVAQAIDAWHALGDAAASAGLLRTVTISAAFGCPFEGEVTDEVVREVVARVVDSGVDELALADTIGAAAPPEVASRIRAVRAVAPGVPLRVHLHNSRSAGLANAYAAILEGVDGIDAATGGLGGCPFAPRATGNIATEDLVYMLERMGIRTTFDLGALVEAVGWAESTFGVVASGMLARAGTFPPRSDAGPARKP